MLNLSKNSPKQPYRLEPLKQLIQNHPIAFWGGIWAALVLVSSVAAVGLLNPGPIEIEQEVPQPTPALKPAPALTNVRESPAKENLPLSLFGAVTLGCAAGSLLVTQALRYSTQARQLPKRLKRTATVRPKRRRPAKKRRTVLRKPQPVDSQPTFQRLDNQLARTDTRLTQVTVLPPEQSHPLNGSEGSLAEMMDLRKRQSLASLMRSQS